MSLVQHLDDDDRHRRRQTPIIYLFWNNIIARSHWHTSIRNRTHTYDDAKIKRKLKNRWFFINFCSPYIHQMRTLYYYYCHPFRLNVYALSIYNLWHSKIDFWFFFARTIKSNCSSLSSSPSTDRTQFRLFIESLKSLNAKRPFNWCGYKHFRRALDRWGASRPLY